MAKSKQESTEAKSKFQEALDKLNKTYGVGTVLALDSKTGGDYDIISTGSIGFDYITLGVGGFVKGRLYELMGWEGTGKSTICGHAAAECQRKGGTVLYIDGEHAVDKNYFQALGVDTTKMLIAQPSCGEEGFNIAMEMINTGEIDLVIIDSDSSLIPKKVLDGEVGAIDHPTIPMSAASPDGLLVDINNGSLGCLEIKCPGTAQHILLCVVLFSNVAQRILIPFSIFLVFWYKLIGLVS